MGVFQFFLNGTALLFVFCMPIALANIGWKIYMANGSWNILMVIAIAWYWVETKGKSLEEIDECFEGVKHSDAPAVEDAIRNEDLRVLHEPMKGDHKD